MPSRVTVPNRLCYNQTDGLLRRSYRSASLAERRDINVVAADAKTRKADGLIDEAASQKGQTAADAVGVKP